MCFLLAKVETINLFWFKKDLRIFDNLALTKALRHGKVLPFFLIEPELWQLPDHSARQWEFVRECLIDLNHSLNQIGLKLIIRVGDIQSVVIEFMGHYKIGGIYSHEETGNSWTFKRDTNLRSFTKKVNIEWHEFKQSGVIRGLKTRKRWAQQWEQHVSKELISAPTKVNYLFDIKSQRLPSSSSLNLNNDKCIYRIRGGRTKAICRLN